MKNALLTSVLLITFYTEARPKKQQLEQKPKTAAFSAVPLHGSNFQDAVTADIAVIMVWANFCNYCTGMKPIFNAVAQSLAESSVKFYLLDFGKSFLSSDMSPLIKQLEKEYCFRMKALPQFLIFKKGILVKEECIGTKTQDQLTELIKRQLV